MFEVVRAEAGPGKAPVTRRRLSRKRLTFCEELDTTKPGGMSAFHVAIAMLSPVVVRWSGAHRATGSS